RGGMCREIVLVDRTPERANGVATDMRYATPLSPTVEVRAGDYHALGETWRLVCPGRTRRMLVPVLLVHHRGRRSPRS
ncbi:MAG TPA: hypothetical protein VFC13_13270, partial [Actinomycetes bacterium]|nr:hypothetical protein [Actinomycetes bacterium]